MNEATTERPTRNTPTTLILAALAAAIGGAVFSGSFRDTRAAQAPEIAGPPPYRVQFMVRGTVDYPHPHLQVLEPWRRLSMRFSRTEQAAAFFGLGFLEQHSDVDEITIRLPSSSGGVSGYVVSRTENGIAVVIDVRFHRYEPSPANADE